MLTESGAKLFDSSDARYEGALKRLKVEQRRVAVRASREAARQERFAAQAIARSLKATRTRLGQTEKQRRVAARASKEAARQERLAAQAIARSLKATKRRRQQLRARLLRLLLWPLSAASAVIAKLLVRRRTVWYLAAHESSCRIAADRRAACHIGALGARRHHTAAVWSFAVASSCWPRVGCQVSTSRGSSRRARLPSACGGGDARRVVPTRCGAMRRDEVGNGRLPPLANNRSSRPRCTGRRHARRSGVCGRWPPPRA